MRRQVNKAKRPPHLSVSNPNTTLPCVGVGGQVTGGQVCKCVCVCESQGQDLYHWINCVKVRKWMCVCEFGFQM